ncbi:1209_t:CDS:1 [Dentiscutata heterogama]|uniref:1209_t:CDS:1 n=1 Tax=Dentiscutata heterogama TaxID=1316150 RepID=A0ACA9LBV7_9GLOM|nr:1209_t:CDS:1 [Dentiscutata heterogama]
MGIYDLEKEIRCILQDSSKIRDYNAKLRNEYMKINDEARQLKVENSKLFSQYACAETSLAKYKAEYYAKSEEVKSLQSVINSFPSGYFDKNNQPDDPERTDSYAKSGGKKNNKPESSSASSEQIIPVTICKEKISLGGLGNSIDIDKLLSSVFTCSILLFLLIVIIWLVVVKKLWNLESIMPKEKVRYPAHKKYINRGRSTR